jgi:hypothetical protein
MKMNMSHESIDTATATMNKSRRMNRYHFNCGDSTHGPVGFCARIRAYSREEALEILRNVLDDEQRVWPCGDPDDNARVEYIRVYFGTENLTIDHIDEIDEIDDEDDQAEGAEAEDAP